MSELILTRTPHGVGRYLELVPIEMNGNRYLRLTVTRATRKPGAGPVAELNLQPHEARKLAATLLAELSDAGLLEDTEVPA